MASLATPSHVMQLSYSLRQWILSVLSTGTSYWPMVMAKATYRGYATSDITDAVDMISVRRTCNVTIY